MDNMTVKILDENLDYDTSITPSEWNEMASEIRSVITDTSVVNTDVLHTKDRAPDVIVRQVDENQYIAVGSEETIDEGANGMQVLQKGVDATPEGGFLQVKGEYFVDEPVDQLTITHDMTLSGSATFYQNVDSDLHGSTWVISANGKTGETIDLAEDADKHTYTIKLESVEDLEVDDLISIRRDKKVFLADDSAELHRIKGIDEAENEVFLHDNLVQDYPVQDNADATYYEPIKVHIEGITIIGYSGDDNYRGIRTDTVVDSSVQNVKMVDVGHSALRLRRTYNSIAFNNYIKGSRMAGSGYGITMSSWSANNLALGNMVNDCCHTLNDLGSHKRDNMYVNNIVATHEGSNINTRGSWRTYVIGNIVYHNGGRGVALASVEDIVENNILIGAGAIRDRSQYGELANSATIRNNHFYGGETEEGTAYGVQIAGDWDDFDRIIIEGNVFHDFQYGRGFWIGTGGIGNEIYIRDNIIRSSSEAIYIDQNIGDVLIENNVIRSEGDRTIQIRRVNGAIIRGNSFLDCDGDVILLLRTGAENIIVTNNYFNSPDVTHLLELSDAFDGETGRVIFQNNEIVAPTTYTIDDPNVNDYPTLYGNRGRDATVHVPPSPVVGDKYLDDGTNTPNGNTGIGRWNGEEWEYLEYE